MWFLFFVYFFTFCSGQSDSDMCDESPYKKCQAVHHDEKAFPVTEEQLAEFCPLIMRYIDCMDKYDKSCDVEIFSLPGQYESIVRLVVDVCDRNTLLHNVFVESLPCYQEVLSNLDKNCFEPRAELYYAVEAQMVSELLNVTEEAGERSEILTQYSLRCLYHVSALSCVADYAASKCNNLARGVTIEIARRSYIVAEDCPSEAMDRLLIMLRKLDLNESLKNQMISTAEDLIV